MHKSIRDTLSRLLLSPHCDRAFVGTGGDATSAYLGLYAPRNTVRTPHYKFLGAKIVSLDSEATCIDQSTESRYCWLCVLQLDSTSTCCLTLSTPGTQPPSAPYNRPSYTSNPEYLFRPSEIQNLEAGSLTGSDALNLLDHCYYMISRVRLQGFGCASAYAIGDLLAFNVCSSCIF